MQTIMIQQMLYFYNVFIWCNVKSLTNIQKWICYFSKSIWKSTYICAYITKILSEIYKVLIIDYKPVYWYTASAKGNDK